MIVDIMPQLYTAIKNVLVDVEMGTSSLDVKAEFPYVTFNEVSNVTVEDTWDSSGENHNQLSFEVNIFTNGIGKRDKAREIRSTIDGVLSGSYSLRRDFSDEVPNFLDRDVYRYVMRYSCIVDKNEVIYRR